MLLTTRIQVCYLQLVSEYVVYNSYQSMFLTTRIRVLFTTRIQVRCLQLVSEYGIYNSYPSVLFATRIKVCC